MTAPAFATPPHGPHRASGVAAVRLRRGAPLPNGRICGETDREVHYVPSPALANTGNTMTARCGTELPHDSIELVDGKGGVPCSPCLLQFLTPRDPRSDPAEQRWREW
jgi:hypothetical protein